MSRILLTSMIIFAAACTFGVYQSTNMPSAFADSTLVQMQDTAKSFGLSTDTARQIQAEYVSEKSSLVGKSIDTITVDLKKGGSPTGTVQVGVFNGDLSVKQLFGIINASDIGTANYATYSFSLTAPQTYQIQSGDRIGIKFSGGSKSNYIAIMTDQRNTFDGTNSYLSYYTNSWHSLTGNDDLFMILKLIIAKLLIYRLFRVL